MKRLLCTCCLIATLLAPMAQVGVAAGAVFDGPGLQGGVSEASNIQGPSKSDLRSLATNMLKLVLNFLALAATIVIVGAGIYLIVGAGSDDSKTKAKNIILYTILGLIVVLLARLAVGFLTKGLPQTLG